MSPLRELLDRAWRLMVVGQTAYGATSWRAVLRHREFRGDEHAEAIGKIEQAFGRADFMRIADVIRYEITPAVQ